MSYDKIIEKNTTAANMINNANHKNLKDILYIIGNELT